MNARRPFVGRQFDVELLLDRMAAAEQGDGGVVLVSGPAGIGKTRLVEEALARHREAAGPIRVGRGVCSARAATRFPELGGRPGRTLAFDDVDRHLRDPDASQLERLTGRPDSCPNSSRHDGEGAKR